MREDLQKFEQAFSRKIYKWLDSQLEMRGDEGLGTSVDQGVIKERR